jgi:molybdate transport system substrate-binding protein
LLKYIGSRDILMRGSFLFIFRVALFGAFALFAGTAPSSARQTEITVYAAASLTDALQTIGKGFTQKTRRPIKFSFASSSTLARQIEAGAPADVFVSADSEWMDYLNQRGLIKPASRRTIASNRLVLIAPVDRKIQLKIAQGFALKRAIGEGNRLAMADPDFVPAGRYGRAALMSLGVWSEVENQIARAENVRVALAFVARSETPLGLVYLTDARADPRVRIVDVFPAQSHPPILYPAALTISTKSIAAKEFLDYLMATDSQNILKRFGFIMGRLNQ